MIALFPNEKKVHSVALAKEIVQYLKEKGVKAVAEDEKALLLGALPLSSVDKNQLKALLAMGGDGTMLRIAHRYHHLQVPVFGVNLGHLGFMADVPVHDLFPSIDALLDGNFDIEERIMLKTQGKSSLFAVNDIVLHRAHNFSLIELEIYIDGLYVNTFLADGVIVATPNGSTAYSLAAGGPILTPKVEAFVLTPICPHTISNRPLVIPATSQVEIRYKSPYAPIEVRADGLDTMPLAEGESVVIERHTSSFKLVNLQRRDFYATLRSKLSWSGKLTP